jgi:hypothetical protein
MLGLAMCWLNTLIGYAKSDHVHNMAYIKTQPLVDMQILWIHHFHSHSFVVSLWDRMELQWVYIIPFENHSIFSWGIWFGWCIGVVHHNSFMLKILFDSNPQSWWMWLTFIKRMNNIHIFIVIRLGGIVVATVWKWRLLKVWWWLGLEFGNS